MAYLIHVQEFIAGFLGTAYLNLHAQGMTYNSFETKDLKSGCIIRHNKCSYFDILGFFLAALQKRISL